jgi:hypothetical protein
MLERLAEESPSTREIRLEWAEVFTLPESRLTEPEVLAGVEERLHRALAIAAESTDPPAARRTALAGRAQLRLGAVLQREDRTQEAEAAYRESVRLQQSLAKEAPLFPFFQIDLCAARQALADFLLQHDRLPEARAVLRESIVELERWQAGGPAGWLRQKLLTTQYHHEAAVLTRMGETALAAEATRTAERLARSPPPQKSGSRPGRDKKGPF